MEKIEMLENIDLGKGIAEMDDNLIEHYVKNGQTNSIIKGKNSIVLGAKGTGKSSILKYVFSKKDSLDEFKNIRIVKAMNHTGEPVFKEILANADQFAEDDLILSWKIYFVNLIWKEYESDLIGLKELEKYLKKHKVIFEKGTLKEIITRAVALTKLFQYKCKDGNGFEHSIKLTPDEALEYINKVKTMKEETFDANYVYSVINKFLSEKGTKIWIMIDRVDEAIINKPELETRAMRALLRAFNDLVQFDRIELKLMLRDDIFSKVTSEGFAALSHISAHCTTPISWNTDQLKIFIVKRIISNSHVKKFYNIEINHENMNIEEADEIFYKIFDDKVDKGTRKPKTFNWIYNHLIDAAGSATPRDFINYFEALFSKMEVAEKSHSSKEKKLAYKPSVYKEAWIIASEKKINTQLYAEYNELKESIERFKEGKAKHNDETLKQLLGSNYVDIVENLIKIGFISKSKNIYEVPYLYRGHLEIKNGNAY